MRLLVRMLLVAGAYRGAALPGAGMWPPSDATWPCTLPADGFLQKAYTPASVTRFVQAAITARAVR